MAAPKRATKTTPASPIAKRAQDAAANAKAELASLLSAIRDAEREIAARFYDLGLALKRIVDGKLYAVQGHANLEALLRAEGIVSERQASKLVKVVTQVKREHALALGLEKTYALLGYTDATPAADTVASLLEEGGTVAGVSAAKASVRQIVAATRAERGSGSPRPLTARAKEAAAMAKAVAAALREAGLRGAAVTVGAKAVRVALPRATVERWMAKR